MKQFIFNCILFSVFFLGLFFSYYYYSVFLLKKNYGLTTEEQIDKQYSDLNKNKDSIRCVFLGSSRFYRGINPAKFDVFSYNFSHDNETYNQIYYKLKHVVETCPNLETVVICYDYPGFSFISATRNSYYNKYMPQEYVNDYTFRQKIEDQIIFPVKQTKYYWSLANSGKRGELSEFGQYIKYGEYATEDDSIVREKNILPLQIEYFRKICALLKERELISFMVVMPMRDGEYKNYTLQDINNYNSIVLHECDNKYLFFLNYLRDARFLSASLYTDCTHLNKDGADLFSLVLNKDINKIMYH